MSHWVGSCVSINCGQSLGTYQGRIYEANDKKITIVKPFRNGVPYPHAEVTLCASDIVNIQIISDSKPVEQRTRSTVVLKKPVAKRHSMSVSEALTSNHQQQQQTGEKLATAILCTSPTKNIAKEVDSTRNATKQLGNLTLQTPFKKDKKQRRAERNDICFGDGMQDPGIDQEFDFEKNLTLFDKQAKKDKKQKRTERNDVCFGDCMQDPSIDQDFDFEKNLALFDKQAIWEEINASQKPDLVRQTDGSRRPDVTKYRHDENVIATLPTMYRQITLNDSAPMEYVTDDGLVIPSVTSGIRERLFTLAEKLGLSAERQTELMGRAGTEISLQLLGGGHRLNPRNTHQFPTVVVLCGKHRQGAVGVNCARQLASHGVDTVVYTADGFYDGPCKKELELYRLTGNKVTTNASDLPTADLIILALSSESLPSPQNASLIDWVNENRAPVLALDPPSIGTPGITTKFSLVPVLPLSHSTGNGKLYLCNLAIPDFVFKEVGIKYKSPFGPKFVIPLYCNDK